MVREITSERVDALRLPPEHGGREIGLPPEQEGLREKITLPPLGSREGADRAGKLARHLSIREGAKRAAGKNSEYAMRAGK